MRLIMKLHLEGAARYRIGAYAPGEVTIGETVYTSSLIVTPERLLPDWAPRGVSDLSAADFEGIAALGPEVVLLGTGRQLRFPPVAALRALIDAGIGYEVMDTGAACRTFNILLAEGRRVAAALLMIEAD
jgi:uncharacterized protein